MKGIKQAADIVNRFRGNQQVILDQMRERDEEVLGQIRDEMYDFFILSRQNEEVRRRLLDEVPMEDWAVALKGTEAPAAPLDLRGNAKTSGAATGSDHRASGSGAGQPYRTDPPRNHGHRP